MNHRFKESNDIRGPFLSSCNKELLTGRQCKSKICLIGGLEAYKDEFQRVWSDASLSLQNKDNIGVNIIRINLDSGPFSKFLIYLWNINCSEKWASYRASFYSGTEGVIVFISELYFDQIKHLQQTLSDVNYIGWDTYYIHELTNEYYSKT